MSVLLLILGFALLAVTSSDVLLTTLTLKGGGFLTNRFSSWVWHWAIKLYKIKQILYYFHTSERSRCLPLSIATFDEAMTLLSKLLAILIADVDYWWL